MGVYVEETIENVDKSEWIILLDLRKMLFKDMPC